MLLVEIDVTAIIRPYVCIHIGIFILKKRSREDEREVNCHSAGCIKAD